MIQKNVSNDRNDTNIYGLKIFLYHFFKGESGVGLE